MCRKALADISFGSWRGLLPRPPSLIPGGAFPPIPRLYTVPQGLTTVRIGRNVRIREDVLIALIDKGDIW
jgi:hypothetical protein